MTIVRVCTLAVVAVLIAAGSAFAVTPDERLNDPELEAKAREITKELRCLVCQNQSIDDSDAGLAKELRVLVRERVLAGDSKEEVLDVVIGIHGEYVLLRPRFGLHTALLWLSPIVLLSLGFLAARGVFQKATPVIEEQPGIDTAATALSDQQKQLLDKLRNGDRL